MKVYLDSIGCRLNQAEIEKFASQFHAAGHQIVGSAGEADLAVINTCTVTTQAASDSRQKIRQASRAGCKRIIPAGCLSTFEGQALLNLDNVEQVIENFSKDHLVGLLLNTDIKEESTAYRYPVEGVRKRTRAFIKVQDGCDQHCTYCITRLVRGKARSIPFKEVIADIHAAEKSGAKEAVISGVQLGFWGRDLSNGETISTLVRLVLAETDIPRLRLSSIEPWDLPEDFYDLWKNPRLCQQLHLPLQSGCEVTLRRMGRLNTPESYLQIVKRIRSRVPEMAITADIIVGFPGEDEDEFLESCRFVEQVKFAGGHVFGFSPREGTPATALPGKISPFDIKERSVKMRSILSQAENNYQFRFLGKTVDVLWEKAYLFRTKEFQLSGLTGTYLRVRAMHDSPISNEISRVKIQTQDKLGLVGSISEFNQ